MNRWKRIAFNSNNFLG